jgi:hypothetical protein
MTVIGPDFAKTFVASRREMDRIASSQEQIRRQSLNEGFYRV